MHFDNAKQFFSNESLLASLGVNTKVKFLTQEECEETLALCPECKEEKSITELKADNMCDICFLKQEAKRIEEDNARWLNKVN